MSEAAQFAFLRTYKPMLKRARGTPSYPDVRHLLRLWLHHKRVRRLLDHQNVALLEAARTRDALLWQRPDASERPTV